MALALPLDPVPLVPHHIPALYSTAKKAPSPEVIVTILFPRIDNHADHDLQTSPQPTSLPLYGTLLSLNSFYLHLKDSTSYINPL